MRNRVDKKAFKLQKKKLHKPNKKQRLLQVFWRYTLPQLVDKEKEAKKSFGTPQTKTWGRCCSNLFREKKKRNEIAPTS